MLLLLEHLDEKQKFSVLKREVLMVPPSSEPLSVTIGRKVDNDLSFPSDKSISRKHCLLIVHPNGALGITDLKSSFGTHLNGIKCPRDEETPLEDKMKIKFGNEFTNVRISKFKFCNTRLDRKEKDRLKEICRLIGGEMVKHVDSCSHLLCSRYSATVKILQALVVQRHIVSFDFAESLAKIFLSSVDECATKIDRRSVLLPAVNESEFRPNQSESVSALTDPTESRQHILKRHEVVLLEKGDEQYVSILKKCGAKVLNLLAMPSNSTSQQLLDELKRQQMEHNCNEPQRTCSIFYEESKSPSAKTILLSRSMNLQFFSTGAFAMSIFENVPPKLLPADTLSQRALSQHQQSQQQSSQFYPEESFTAQEDVRVPPSKMNKNLPSSVPVIKEEEESQKGIKTENFIALPAEKIAIQRDDGKVAGITRVTTLLPSQEPDTNKASPVAMKNNNLNNKPPACHHSADISNGKRPLLKPNLPTTVVQTAMNEECSSPMSMCDINIVVDLSPHPHDKRTSPSEEAQVSTTATAENHKTKGLNVENLTSKSKGMPFPDAKQKKAIHSQGEKAECFSSENNSVINLEPDISDTPLKGKKRKVHEQCETNESVLGIEDNMEFSVPPSRSRKGKKRVGDDDSTDIVCAMAEQTPSCNKYSSEPLAYYPGDEVSSLENKGWCVAHKFDKVKMKHIPKSVDCGSIVNKTSITSENNELVDDIVEYPKAVSVEVRLNLRNDPPAENSRASKMKGDKRCFSKNFVRGRFQLTTAIDKHEREQRPLVVISVGQMDSLLPKESEREIQLQKDYEEEQLEQVQKDELFNERMESRRGKRKLFG